MISCQTIVIEGPSDSMPGKSKVQIWFRDVEATNPTELENIAIRQLRLTAEETLRTLQKEV